MAANWQDWIAMAEESLEAGEKTFSSSPRSSASRYYYAAYQAMTALLLYKGEAPPQDREAWGHVDTANRVRDNLASFIDKKGYCENLSKRLGVLYKVRVSADYISIDDVRPDLIKVRKDATFLVKVAKEIIVKGR